MSEDSIAFPNLHITFEHVGKGINIGGFEIAYYGMVIALGMLLAFVFMTYMGKKEKISPDDITDYFLWAVVIGIVGARLYYVVFSWNDYKNDLLQILNLRGGGLAIYGGIIAGIATIAVISKRKRIPVFRFLDLTAFGLLIGQICGRWGNFFNREVFGGYSNGLLAMQLPVSAVRDSSDITSEMLSKSVTVDGIKTVLVHPTFLYESLWNLGIFVILLFLRKNKKFDGELIAVYLGLYGIGRFWIEAVRTDRLVIAGTNIAVSQLVAMICILFSIVFIITNIRRLRSK